MVDTIQLDKKEDKVDIKSFFGEWINDIDKIKFSYANAKPFEHVIINNFLSAETVDEIDTNFPLDLSEYNEYMNPIEVKYAYNNIDNLNEKIKRVFDLLSTNFMENIFSEIVGSKLESDPFLHGAGLHVHPVNGRLGIHLDYEIHPITGKQRKLNIILYLSRDWNPEWGGETELWDISLNEPVIKSKVLFNSAIIFKTNDISWHGMSSKIKCPEGVYRKTLAFYYVSDETLEKDSSKIGNDGSGYRKKATFIANPNCKYKDKLEPFLKIRPNRRIEKSDIDLIWPEWNSVEY